MMTKQRATIAARVDPEERRELREILLRGGLTVQDFLGACVRAALGEKDPIGGGPALDPVGAVAFLRRRSPPGSYVALARRSIGVETSEGSAP